MNVPFLPIPLTYTQSVKKTCYSVLSDNNAPACTVRVCRLPHLDVLVSTDCFNGHPDHDTGRKHRDFPLLCNLTHVASPHLLVVGSFSPLWSFFIFISTALSLALLLLAVFCGMETLNTAGVGDMVWPRTPQGETASVTCSSENAVSWSGTRACGGYLGRPTWLAVSLKHCPLKDQAAQMVSNLTQRLFAMIVS